MTVADSWSDAAVEDGVDVGVVADVEVVALGVGASVGLGDGVFVVLGVGVSVGLGDGVSVGEEVVALGDGSAGAEVDLAELAAD